MMQTLTVGEKILIALFALGERGDETETIASDILEYYVSVEESKGKWQAWLWAARQVGGSIRSLMTAMILWRFSMLKNIFKVAMRNLKRNPGYSAINVLGLAIGLTSCILIALYVSFELNYDRHTPHADRIVRLGVQGRNSDKAFELAISPNALAPALPEAFPEVELAARVFLAGNPVLRVDNLCISEERFFRVDPQFFSLFSIPFIEGKKTGALTEPGQIVLTQTAAKRYFGQQSPIGKSIEMDGDGRYQVVGMIPDVPANSHLHYDVLASVKPRIEMRWLGNSVLTYARLNSPGAISALREKLPALAERYVGPRLREVLGLSAEEIKAQGRKYGFCVRPMLDIHLRSFAVHEPEPIGDINHVRLFGLIGIAVLLIAMINFMNLSTARSVKRAREVGIRKTLGSGRGLLIRQFFGETLFMAGLAMAVAVVAVSALLPAFNQLTGRPLSFDLIGDPWTLPVLIALVVVVGLMSGIYPALFLSAFQPCKVLKGAKNMQSRKSTLRKGLVAFQFFISTSLLVATAVVYMQLQFFQSQKLGFNQQRLVVIRKTGGLGSQMGGFLDALKGETFIHGTTQSTSIPGRSMGDNTYFSEENPSGGSVLIPHFYSDPDFLSTYEMALSDGRMFSPEMEEREDVILLNQAAVKRLGMKNPVGKRIFSRTRRNAQGRITYTVIGVVADYHQQSLHEPISPRMIRPLPRNYAARYITLRLSPGDPAPQLTKVRALWTSFTDLPCDLVFFDEEFGRLYTAERQTGRILILFAGLAILVASMGLFGLSSFTVEQRTKEIGVRKVLGASMGQMAVLLTQDIFRLIALGTLVAWPLTWWTMRGWLQNFAYRTAMPYGLFPAATLAVASVAFCTVGYHILRAYRVNPVKTLKHD